MKDGTYLIYQLDRSAITAQERFLSFDALAASGKEPDASHYNAVYSGRLPDPAENNEAMLEALYSLFNSKFPADYHGYSMSVSDIIVLKDASGMIGGYYVDSVGFRRLRWGITVRLLCQQPDRSEGKSK